MTPQDKKRIDSALMILIQHILSSAEETKDLQGEVESKTSTPKAMVQIRGRTTRKKIELAIPNAFSSVAEPVKNHASTARKRRAAQLSLFPTQTE